jgi:hypothetical protein
MEGSRYTLEVREARLRLLGPVETEPSTVALDVPIHTLDATSFGGRLVISERAAPGVGLVVVFMNLSGGDPERIADSICRLATGTADL